MATMQAAMRSFRLRSTRQTSRRVISSFGDQQVPARHPVGFTDGLTDRHRGLLTATEPPGTNNSALTASALYSRQRWVSPYVTAPAADAMLKVGTARSSL